VVSQAGLCRTFGQEVLTRDQPRNKQCGLPATHREEPVAGTSVGLGCGFIGLVVMVRLAGSGSAGGSAGRLTPWGGWSRLWRGGEGKR